MLTRDISRPEQVFSGAEISEKKELLKKLEEKSNTRQGQSEIGGSFDDQYELIIEYLLQIPPSNDRLEILRKQGHSQSDIDEMFSQGDSWYTQSTISSFRSYNSPPSLMDSKYSLSKQVSVWSALDHNLTESQKKLNIELLNVLKYLEWHDEGALFDYDNGQVDELEEFLKNNRGNPDLKAVLNVKRGESGSTVLHAIAGAHIGASYRQEDRPINLLLEAGASPNIQDDKGETPLHRASAMGYDKNIYSLLRGNADPNICDGQGKTPQQTAVDNHNYHVERRFFTDNQKKLRKELNNILNEHRYKEGNLGYIVTLTLFQFLEDLEEFLHEHKNNKDLKVVLNTRDIAGKSEVLEHVKNAFSGFQAADEIKKLLLEAGAKEFTYERKKCLPKSGVLWGNIIPAQKEKLSRSLGILSEIQDINQLEKFVKIAIKSGVRLNYRFTVPSPFEGYSFTDYVIKRISELEKYPKVASGIICQLVSKGAVFGSPESIDVIDELGLECKDHKANMIKAFEGYINDAHRFIKVAKSATTSKLNDIAIGNTTLYLEYSEESKIDIAKITDGARSLWLTHENAGYERNIVKIGESEVEIITQNGKRHYTDLTANSNIALIFCTSFGELEVRLYSDKQNENRIRVEARDQGMLKKLKDCGEEIGKNCSLGYHSVYDAIERGYFEKPAPSSRIVQEEKLQNGKWADQVRYTRKNGAQIG